MDAVEASLRRNPVTALLGPRQVGKSTLARLFADRPENRFDLENPIDLARLAPDSYGLLSSLQGVVVIDEIQQAPELFPQLRVIVDEPTCRCRFLVTGSASPALTNHTAETLAGRVRLIEIGGFDLQETGGDRWEELWFRGGFPRAFLAANDRDAHDWLDDFLKTYVMRDVQALAGGGLSPQTLARLLLMLAHYHGQFWNQKEVAAALGIDTKTLQRYLDVFVGAYLIRMLPPFEKNIGKRIRKAHRLYFRDSGLLHRLFRIGGIATLRSHDRLGASWEGFAIEQLTRLLGASEHCFFWRTHAGSEIDLVVPQGDRVLGFEFKVSSAPTISKGTHEAMRDLGIQELYVIHSGPNEFRLGEAIRAVPIRGLAKLVEELLR